MHQLGTRKWFTTPADSHRWLVNTCQSAAWVLKSLQFSSQRAPSYNYITSWYPTGALISDNQGCNYGGTGQMDRCHLMHYLPGMLSIITSVALFAIWSGYVFLFKENNFPVLLPHLNCRSGTRCSWIGKKNGIWLGNVHSRRIELTSGDSICQSETKGLKVKKKIIFYWCTLSGQVSKIVEYWCFLH